MYKRVYRVPKVPYFVVRRICSKSKNTVWNEVRSSNGVDSMLLFSGLRRRVFQQMLTMQKMASRPPQNDKNNYTGNNRKSASNSLIFWTPLDSNSGNLGNIKKCSNIQINLGILFQYNRRSNVSTSFYVCFLRTITTYDFNLFFKINAGFSSHL